VASIVPQLSLISEEIDRSIELEKLVIEEISSLIIAHDLVDTSRAINANLQGFT